jgi:hypothetical protein
LNPSFGKSLAPEPVKATSTLFCFILLFRHVATFCASHYRIILSYFIFIFISSKRSNNQKRFQMWKMWWKYNRQLY